MLKKLEARAVAAPLHRIVHTPGPWTLNGPCGFANEKHGFMVYAQPPSGNGHLVASIRNEYSENQEANARLIAAAPELLEACQLLLRQISDGDTQIFEDVDEEGKPSACEMIQAAVKNATSVV